MTDEQARAWRPRSAPDHAWPIMTGCPPVWWHWYELQLFTGLGRVIEVAGSGNQLTPLFHRTVMSGSEDAAKAAYRLLVGAFNV